MDARLLDYLLEDDAPHPGDALEDFGDLELPPGLADDTLARVLDTWDHPALDAPSPDPKPANRRWISPVLAAGLAAAAALLVVRSSTPEVGDLADMTERGGGGASTPALELKMAAERDGSLERLRADRTYAPGDRLYFRYASNADGWVHLVHAGPAGVEVLVSQRLPAGEADLTDKDQAIFWEIDSVDTSSSFALLRTPDAVPAAELTHTLQAHLPVGQAVEPEPFCVAARAQGLACDAAWVEVSP